MATTMRDYEDPAFDPDWETPLSVTVTPAALIDTIFATAFSVHTGTQSCVGEQDALVEIVAPDDNGGNFCRYVEQEYSEDSDPEAIWHDWTVELRIGQVLVVGHWWARVGADNHSEWEWCEEKAGQAFRDAALFVGKRVRKGLVVEDAPWSSERASRVHH